jgi:response regulator RpfG family c-di-GMP phosphodiesterase
MESMTPIRVLIADPDQSLLAVYRELLRKDFDVVTACNGLKCVTRLRERTPDVLVLEPQLPWGGGAGVLAAMHEDSGLAEIPVMILTACRDRQVLESVAPFPIRDYHVKPLSPSHLGTRIRKVLRFRGEWRALNDDHRGLKTTMFEKEPVPS